MRTDSQLRPGDKIGNYCIIRPLGVGGAGTVYLAEGVYGTVAIKVFHHWTPELEKEFLLEGQTACKINHPNVVNCLDAQVEPGTKRCYLVMEYVDGGTAMDLLKKGEKLDWEWACYIALSVAQALEAAAQYKIVHRDMKPENIMILSSGIVKLADLGIAWRAGEKNTGRIQGTPAYIAPEQIQKNAVIDCRCDIYSLGATLYHLLTGELPFKADSLHEALDKALNAPPPDPRNVRPDIPRPVAELVMKMMAKSPAARPQSAAKLVTILTRILRMNMPAKSFSKALNSTSASIWLNNVQQWFFKDGKYFKISLSLLLTVFILGLLPPFIRNVDYTPTERKERRESYEKFIARQGERYAEIENGYSRKLRSYIRRTSMDNSQLLMKKIAVDSDLESVRNLLKNQVPMPNSIKSMELFKNYRPKGTIPRERAEQMADFLDAEGIKFPQDLWESIFHRIMRANPKVSEEYYWILEGLLYSANFRSTVNELQPLLVRTEKRDMSEAKREIFQRMKYLFETHKLTGKKQTSAAVRTDF